MNPKVAKSIIKNDENFRNNCVKKWKRLLVAENATPIKDPHTRAVTAVLLENQSRVLKEDAAATNSSIWGAGASYGGALAQGDTYAKGDNRLPKVLLPMIRRTFPELISNEVVGVQPMSGPVSLAFAIRYRYDKGTLHEGRAAGTLINPTEEGPQFGVGTVRDGVDMTQAEATVGGAGTELGYNYLDSTFTGRRNSLFNRTINPATQAPWTDAEILESWNASGAGDQVTTLAELTELAAGADDAATAAKKLLAVTSLAGGKFNFSDQDLGTAALVGDYEATGRIPKTKFTFEKKAVEAGTRRIGTSWTLELEQDIRNMNGIDIENEVTSMMSYELQAEIDREMIVRMLYAALSANEYSYWDGSKADARWMAERDRAFYQFIIQMSNRMTIRNRRGPANFIIATPDVCSLLETLPQYALMEVNGTVSTDNSGIAKVGTIGGGRFTVYRDTRTPVQNNAWVNNAWDNQGQYTVGGAVRTQGIPDFALLGYKGSEYWDAGILFCPYIPIMLQRVVDPVSFEPNVGLLTRYGVVDNLFGANLYYHVILIDTLGNTLPPAATPANNFPGTYPSESKLGEEAVRGGYPVEVTTKD
jgi:Major capsid protein Gp23